MGIVYSYKNKINGKRYIGQTINPKQRHNQHVSSSSKVDNKFYRAIQKYGWDNFDYEVLCECENRQEMNDRESEFIKNFNSVEGGYNIRSGGEHPDMGQETKDKIRDALYFVNGALSNEEVIELRNAYANYESPSEIYKEKYEGKLHFNSFLNIWTGQRYKQVMPEVFINRTGRRKYTPSLVKEIRKTREGRGLSYSQLAELFNIPKPTIADIIKRRTWKNI